MSDTISFNFFTPTREPGDYIEDNAIGQPSVGNQTICLIGQKNPSGTATANQDVLAVNQANINTLCGVGSMLADMYSIAIQNNTAATFYVAPVTGTGLTAAVYSITVTGPATGAGTLYFEVGGYPIDVGVNNGDTATIIAGNISSAFNINPQAPVTCTSAAGVVTVTVKPSGITAGDVPVVINYLGAAGDETLPPGVGISIALTTPAAGDVDLATFFTNINNMGFSAVICPYAEQQIISELTTHFNESTGQWSPNMGHGGVWFSGMKGTVTGVTTFTAAQNDPYGSIVAISTSSPQPEYLTVTAYGCAIMQQAATAPYLPFDGIVLQGIQAWTTDFSRNDRETLLLAGASTLKVKGGQVVIDRVLSLYETNALGYADTSYLNLNTALSLMVVNQYLADYMAVKYPRIAIVDDGTPLNGSNNFTTLAAMKSSAGCAYQDLCNMGICQNAAVVRKGILAGFQNGQVSFFIPGELTGPVIDIAVNFTFSPS